MKEAGMAGAFPHCRHGDDMRTPPLLTHILRSHGIPEFIASIHYLEKSGGLGPPPQMQIIRRTFPHCIHGDEMMFPFSSCASLQQAGGGWSPSIRRHCGRRTASQPHPTQKSWTPHNQPSPTSNYDNKPRNPHSPHSQGTAEALWDTCSKHRLSVCRGTVVALVRSIIGKAR